MIDWVKLGGFGGSVFAAVLLFIGIVMLTKSSKADNAQVAKIGANVVMGMIVFGLGIAGLVGSIALSTMGTNLLDMLGIKTK